MADTFGFSFSPDASNRMRQSMNSGVLPQNASEALRILSLHLPAMLAGNPIAPDALLRPSLPGAGPFDAQPFNPGGAPSQPQAPRASAGPVQSQPFGPSGMPRASAGPAAAMPFEQPPSNTMGPSGGQGGYSGTVPTIGFGGPETQPAAPMMPAPNNGGILELLNSLFSGVDVGGGRGSFGGGGRFL